MADTTSTSAIDRDQALTHVEAPEITVVVTAHNEEESIQACLRALRAQDFPMERVEILLIDDRSRDATVARARELKMPSLRIISIDQPPERLTARQAALDLGIREARGEIVCLTDADSRVPREWLRELSGHLSFRDGAVTGPVVYGGNHHFIARYQSIESLLRFTLYRIFDRHNWATGVNCNNLALRRTAYIESGGFEAAGFDPAEGAALARTLKKGGWSIRYMIEPVIQTMDCGSLSGLISRSRRKARATIPLLTSIVLFLIITNMALLAWAALGSQSFLASAFVLGLRYAAGAGLFALTVGQYRRYPAVSSVWLFEPMLTFVGLCAYLSLIFNPRWQWADINYGRKGPRPLDHTSA